MTPRKTAKAKGIDRYQRASMALDDLVWTLKGLKLDYIKEASELLRLSVDEFNDQSAVAREYKSGNSNKHFLIGALPRLFQDRKLFPSNDDIVEFAGIALGLEMSGTQKRSRYEIIGKVVCETDQLDEQGLTNLVTALDRLLGNSEKFEQMVQKKKTGSFSWNETIQDLLTP